MSTTNAVQQVIADLRYHWPSQVEICVAADLLETQQAMLAEKDETIAELRARGSAAESDPCPHCEGSGRSACWNCDGTGRRHDNIRDSFALASRQQPARGDAYWQSVCEAMARAEFVDTKKVVLADKRSSPSQQQGEYFGVRVVRQDGWSKVCLCIGHERFPIGNPFFDHTQAKRFASRIYNAALYSTQRKED